MWQLPLVGGEIKCYWVWARERESIYVAEEWGRLPKDGDIFRIYFSTFQNFLLKTSRPVFSCFPSWLQSVTSFAKCCYPVACKLRWHACTGGPVQRAQAAETQRVLHVLVASLQADVWGWPSPGPETTLCTPPSPTPVPFHHMPWCHGEP